MEKFGNYEIMGKIGSGGMADVFKAIQTDLKRIVAIKKIKPHLAEDQNFIRMFRDEAVIAANLNHPSIVTVYEMGRLDRYYYISMEYVEGKTLAQIIEKAAKLESQVPVEYSLFILTKVAGALQFAHEKNIIHRDVSPSNILISREGRVKLADFGIARACHLASSRTVAGILKGKLSYLSPEQARGEGIDHRSDIFAMGTVMFELITGKKLFAGETEFEILEKVRNFKVESALSSLAGIPQELSDIMRKSLKEKEQRYQNVSAILLDLEEAIKNLGLFCSEKNIAEYLRNLFFEKEKADVESTHQIPVDTRIVSLKFERRFSWKKASMLILTSGAILLLFFLFIFRTPPQSIHSSATNRPTGEIAPVTSRTEQPEPKNFGHPQEKKKVERPESEPQFPSVACEKEKAGIIYVNVNPQDASTYLDGIPEGEGNKVIKNVSPGRHTIKIVHPDYEEEFRVIEITQEETIFRVLYRNGEIQIQE